MSSDPLRLTDKGAKIVARGGDDSVDDDGMLILEIQKLAPGMSSEDMQLCFVNLRLEYGMDALRAIRTGHVKFERREPQ